MSISPIISSATFSAHVAVFAIEALLLCVRRRQFVESVSRGCESLIRVRDPDHLRSIKEVLS